MTWNEKGKVVGWRLYLMKTGKLWRINCVILVNWMLFYRGISCSSLIFYQIVKWLEFPLSKGKVSYHSSRATDKARKSVITHWKSAKTHWKNKHSVKIRISILRYAFVRNWQAHWLNLIFIYYIIKLSPDVTFYYVIHVHVYDEMTCIYVCCWLYEGLVVE